MAAIGARVVVGTAPTRLNTSTPTPGDPIIGSSLVVRAPTGGASVFLGGSAVATTDGFELLAGESIPVDLGRGENLYGIVASGTVTVHVLEVGV